MPYRHFSVAVISAGGKFFYQPAVSLDPATVAIVRTLSGHFEVNFTVEMWSADMESQVVDFLLERGHGQANVAVIPFGKVRLTETTTDVGLFSFPHPQKSYEEAEATLNFQVVCKNQETARRVSAPEFLAEHVGLLAVELTAASVPHLLRLRILRDADRRTDKRFAKMTRCLKDAEMERDTMARQLAQQQSQVKGEIFHF